MGATEQDLKNMGLVENKDGTWSKKRFTTEGLKKKNYVKKEEGIMPLIIGKDGDILKYDPLKWEGKRKSYEIEIKNPPVFFIVGKRKCYCTANAFYSTPHWKVRDDMKQAAWAYLAKYVAMISSPLQPSTTLEYIFSERRKIGPKTLYDIDNRGFFWDKMFSDLLEYSNLVPQDNAFFLSRKIYRFDETIKQKRLIIKIY